MGMVFDMKMSNGSTYHPQDRLRALVRGDILVQLVGRQSHVSSTCKPIRSLADKQAIATRTPPTYLPRGSPINSRYLRQLLDYSRREVQRHHENPLGWLAGVARYKLLEAPRGFGRRIDAAAWEREYATGYEQRFLTLQAMPRQMIMAGYVERLCPAPVRVLDVGCGPGALARALVSSVSQLQYTGFDLSTAAIEEARRLAIDYAPRPLWPVRFVVGDMESPPQPLLNIRYDAIVMNEVLQYARDPLAVACRYSQLLRANGILVVTLARLGNVRAIWRRLGRSFSTLAGTSLVSMGSVAAADIRVLQRR